MCYSFKITGNVWKNMYAFVLVFEIFTNKYFFPALRIYKKPLLLLKYNLTSDWSELKPLLFRSFDWTADLSQK